ncbi:MAG: ferrous iron transport protein B, partial [Oscillospiraceae bacterium]
KSKACRSFFYNGASERAIEQVAQLIGARAIAKKLSAFYAAAKIVEGDELTEELLQLGLREKGAIEAIIREMERKLGTDREAAIADMRYGFIDKLCRSNFKRGKQSREQRRSVKIDAVLTHRYFALPIFFLIMLAVFWLTFGIIGSKLSASTEFAIAWLSARADGLLTKISVAPMLHSLITDGIFVGVGSVLSFLPTILVLFLMLSILEDTGYMARVAFIMDKLLRKIGLSGRSFVPMLIGFGCSVPAIMATRTLPSERDRKMTALLVPFMSCSAKLPIYAMFTEVFFKKHKALVLISLYILGMAVGVLYGLFFKNTVFKSDPVPFVMELPAYRFPSAKNVLMTIRLRAKDFLVKAFTIIFIASILVWFLQRFDFSLRIVADAGESMLAAIGKLIAPAFAPLGFADWRASTALITGLSAKEAVVSTINVLVSSSGAELSDIFTPLSAYAFLVFTLLYMPCIAAVATIKREIGSAVSAFLAMLSQTAIAWLIAFAVYNIGGLLMR